MGEDSPGLLEQHLASSNGPTEAYVLQGEFT
jgi:hypothetical protein